MSREEYGSAPAEAAPEAAAEAAAAGSLPTAPAALRPEPATRAAPRPTAPRATAPRPTAPRATATRLLAPRPSATRNAVPRPAMDGATAPGAGPVVPDTDPTPDAAAAPGPSAAPSAAPRRRTVTAVLATACLGLLAGWVGASAWRSSSARDAALTTLGATAVITAAAPAGDASAGVGAELDVLITNIGAVPLTVGTGPLGFDASAVTGLDPSRLSLPAAARGTLLVHVAVACDSPQPLTLAPLRVTGPDGSTHPLRIDGSSQALVDLCTAGPAATQVLSALDATPDGKRLRVTLTAPTGRVTTVDTVSAGGVPLSGDPLPAVVDGPHALWLDPPQKCPPEWSRIGIPRTLTVQLDAGGRATLEVPVGYGLSAWLLRTACPAGAA